MGSGFKSFTAGAVLTASDMNNYLMEQSVMYFATTTARDTAITAPEDGMVVYIGSNDANEGLYTYHGSAWRKGPGWNAPWGLVASGASNTTGTTTGTTEATIKISPSFTAFANRNYRCQITGTFQATVAGEVYDLNLRDNSLTGTILGMTRFTPSVGNYQYNICVQGTGVLAAAGTRSIYYTVQRLTTVSGGVGGSLAGVALYWSIEDVGPSGAPV